MTSDRQIASNRNNGRRGRGPRTLAGKVRSSRNALRHGLSVSVLDEPSMSAEVESLARAIAGNGADNFQLNQARMIAEAQLDLFRIQEAKVRLMNSHIMETTSPKAATHGDGDILDRQGDARLAAMSEEPSGETKFPQEFLMVPTLEGLRQLTGLEDYEHRAISRRRRAMRAFLA